MAEKEKVFDARAVNSWGTLLKELERFSLIGEDRQPLIEGIRKLHPTIQQQIFGFFTELVFHWAELKENEMDYRLDYTVLCSRMVKKVLQYPGAPLV